MNGAAANMVKMIRSRRRLDAFPSRASQQAGPRDFYLAWEGTVSAELINIGRANAMFLGNLRNRHPRLALGADRLAKGD